MHSGILTAGIRRFGPVAALPLAMLACDSDAGQLNAPPATMKAGLTIVPAVIEMTEGTTRLLEVTVRDETGAVVPGPIVTWESRNVAVASVTPTGMVTAISTGNASVIATSGALADTAEIRVTPQTPTGPFIEIHPEVVYQLMTGWEGTAQIGEVECAPGPFALYQQELVDRLVNELGINRIRLEIRSGFENPVDYYAQFLSHRQVDQWAPHRYASVNDNDDPKVARVEGFHFTEVDHKVQMILQPFQTALAARGEKLYVNLNYVDFGASPWEHSSDPEEYAELIYVTFVHLRDRYGWVPDAVEISLEPDNTTNWTPQAIGQAIVATGDRLKAAGFRPAFIAPSTTNMTSAISYLDGVLSVPRVLDYLTDVSYHRYSGVSDASLATIAARGAHFGLRTAMLEHIGSDYRELHEDLRVGQNSAWQQFALAFCNPQDTGGDYYRVDDSNPASPKVILTGRARYLRQYFPFIRLNAQRIGAFSGEPLLDPLAFRNSNGKLAIIIMASNNAPVQLRGLPAGVYGVTYTTDSQSFVAAADVVVGAAGTLVTSMPSAGVITIHQR
jgi:hypothetical protein